MIERKETKHKVQPTSYVQILEAIAKGVESRLKRTVIINIVTLETIFIARKLQIPEKEIQEWRTSRCYHSGSTKDQSFSQNIEFGK